MNHQGGKTGGSNRTDRLLLIYIAGYGRSGSTALDLALSATCPTAVSLGEIGSLPRALRKPRLGCSCGEGYIECALWSNILRNPLSSFGSKELKRLEAQDGPLGFIRKPAPDYVGFWEEVLKRRQSVSEAEVLVDSTKTVLLHAARPKNLAALNNVDVIIIHLKRSLRGVMASRSRGRNVDLAGFRSHKSAREWFMGFFWPIVVPVNWLIANASAERLKRDKNILASINISFNNVKKCPEDAAIELWHSVENLVQKDLKLAKTADGVAPVGHIVEGNRLTQGGRGVTIRVDKQK